MYKTPPRHTIPDVSRNGGYPCCIRGLGKSRKSQAVLSLPILPQRRLCITPLGYAKQNGTEVLHCVSGGCFARWSVSVCVVLSPGFLAYKLLNLFHMHCLRESSRSLAHPTGSACLLQAAVFVERLVPPHCRYLGWTKAISP
ncbi:hypothetical protein SCLCIDRAFT_1212228 [Scleroderma citrinum Foug A]|uniref:Uncharacterized protein n=1 Tax=Scleroderma citrinum Foug A TaxID=1036808 RepID=A0A0C3EC29_9AGAM|nr:hypothetical protein SCLCIDRAFT_1212228 [Scleroderma citrinum Foug A]